MRTRLTAAVFVLWVGLCGATAQQAPGASWKLLDFGDTAAYAMDVKGDVAAPGGATVSVRCANPKTAKPGVAEATLPAAGYRRHRVKLSAEVQTAGVNGGATIWLRVNRDSVQLVFEDGLDHPVRGDTAAARREISLPVPADATVLSFGVLLMPGGGSVEVRNLRVELGAQMTGSAPIAPAAAKVLDAAIAIVKENALRADRVDWTAVEPEVRAAAAGAEQASDVYPAIELLLARLEDRHSLLMRPAAAARFESGGAENAPMEVRPLPDGVAYVGVPRYQGREPAAARAYITQAQAAIAGAAPTAACGWVVDLRRNGGGNMWPMVGGLRPLLGTGVLGAFEGPRAGRSEWTVRSEPDIEITPRPELDDLPSAWVAVLTGPRTASSGEFVAIAFRGRPRARSFGEPTAGLSTSNETYPLPDGSMIILTNSVGLDRTGRRYGGKIEPDEPVTPGNGAAPGDDAALAAAVRWLKQSSGCATIRMP